MLNRLIQISGFAVVLTVLIVTAGAHWLSHWVNAPLPLEQEKIIAIKSGDTLTGLSHTLEREGLLVYPRLLNLYARLTDRTQINIGEYRIAPQTTPDQLLDLLNSDQVISYRVSLIEGKTFKEFLSVLNAGDKIKSLASTLTTEQLLAEINPELSHPEGWFFPDTYTYTNNTSEIDLLKRAHQKMQAVLQEEWEKREEGLPYDNAYQALIMASIIEKETGQASERATIAGVFVRRLQKGMRLQTDPTVIYGLGDDFDGNIRRKHLREPTAYNTYVIKGLPPTPIAMPGREAIHAALHPEKGESLYFVGKGDGSHYFSKTLEEHNQAVRKYQIEQRKADYRSAPQ